MRTVTVSATNLFRLAAIELGDPLQWVAIARCNRLKDPMIDTLITLVIPSPSRLFADGIGPQ